MLKRSSVTVEAVTAGIDWISATLGREEIDNQTWVYDAIHALELVTVAGNTYKRRSLLGFDGWESGGCFVGSNDKMHYAQFAGHWANDAYVYLEHPKVHISRIDVQVTVQYSQELLREGRYQYARAINYNKALPEHRRRRIHLYAGDEGADTVYVGSPSSEQRGRIYNKDKQSGEQDFKHSWRYEAVYRNEHAASVYRSIIAEVRPSPAVYIPIVVEFFRQRGINILGLDDWGGIIIESPKPGLPDAGRKLAWIKEQVVPTIRKLAEMGYAEDLMLLISEAIAAARNSQG